MSGCGLRDRHPEGPAQRVHLVEVHVEKVPEVGHQFAAGDHSTAEAFLNIRNIMNTDPVIVHQGPGGSTFLTTTTSREVYDSLGRVFRVGVRFKM